MTADANRDTAGSVPHDDLLSPGDDAATAPAPVTGEVLLERVVQSAHAGIDRLAESAAPHCRRGFEGARENRPAWVLSLAKEHAGQSSIDERPEARGRQRWIGCAGGALVSLSGNYRIDRAPLRQNAHRHSCAVWRYVSWKMCEAVLPRR